MSKDKEQHYQNSIEFISEPTDLFYLQTEVMDWTTFNALSGYDLWHRRLGPTPHQNIKEKINCSMGLEGLVGKKFNAEEKCPSCMVGKSKIRVENYRKRLEPASRSLERVNMDRYSSAITSIEGYNHAVIFADSYEEYR